ncbi:class I SAM-dependent methyltransferase [Gilvimarinus sp. SDUM040013]|uniref:Class I SAM-dependent methyltransferase n=1 Tax=Gilvimarinus gilvus TaxID=3058038 RepID=A0ABU4S742_9GAMM|nr:class I SAM-dependent methyltransferase [Gilvimarinus sp. SDUM040013]MDO3386140.1 class I SAM-dependent methyltransferase [Gilvimarinus sp. SDUM040013]MDX6851469.1 class I SAM-dependent methyltransferase [Gilvimarinus sp. SDUM040013]
MDDSTEQQILTCWSDNTAPWVKAINNGEIASRTRITNGAIINAIEPLKVNSLLDIGCGEGWLVRELTQRGIQAAGIDGSQGLIAKAQELGPEDYTLLTYQQLTAARIARRYDLAVCNFSLLGKESVEQVFRAVPHLLNNNGYFVVQTLHPITASQTEPYVDGWRQGNWAGFNKDFKNPAPWYFRTLETWLTFFINAGFTLRAIQAPPDPTTQKPASLIITGQL